MSPLSNSFLLGDDNAIAVYCGSSTGREPAYAKAAASVGKALGNKDRRLVYGGGFSGLMGAVSDAVLVSGGRITGITPRAIFDAGGEGTKPNLYPGSEASCSDQVLVDSMHERKVEMAKRAAGFIGLPGGFGTFDEVVEATTWTQIGIHDKPVVLLNVLSFYEPLRQLIKNSIEAGFIQPEYEKIVIFVDGPANREAHADFDWGEAAVDAIDDWRIERAKRMSKTMFDWTNCIDKVKNGQPRIPVHSLERTCMVQA
ncbi:hypothetical protein K435DRAFT_741547 [Dendrothele bispora CBS 962.96]|uniref:Cytokinin riboside 5'-monophosphate phosphoribohydrolase n=1 Tax=Dendrothele bispora (strain CBS 962.96) TaxID=1314807 RepID=A0A4S8MX98_DENBC|nr:hypothetical protein K435DRAFT_741547 [Dendrothele bispora CBS 962.96]